MQHAANSYRLVNRHPFTPAKVFLTCASGRLLRVVIFVVIRDEQIILRVECIEERSRHIEQRPKSQALGHKKAIVDCELRRVRYVGGVWRDKSAAAHISDEAVAGIKIVIRGVAAFGYGVHEDRGAANEEFGDGRKALVGLAQGAGVVARLDGVRDEDQFVAAHIFSNGALTAGEGSKPQ